MQYKTVEYYVKCSTKLSGNNYSSSKSLGSSFRLTIQRHQLYNAHSLLDAGRMDFVITKFQINQCILLAYQGVMV